MTSTLVIGTKKELVETIETTEVGKDSNKSKANKYLGNFA